MADEIFTDPRLAAVYDAFDDDRSDLTAYLGLLDELGARRLLDLGCGTGTFALLAADRGCTVTGVDPAGASLEVARAKPGALRVSWVHGDARTLPPVEVDVVTMTGNVAQAIVDPADWDSTLDGAHEVLRPGGHLVFETRDPGRRAWTEWTREASHRTLAIDGVGTVETWGEVTGIAGPLVTIRGTWVFHADGAVRTSESTLRFRSRDEIEAALDAHGFTVTDVRGAPDRPGRELVFLARRRDGPPAGR